MKVLSTALLADIVARHREHKGYTQEELGNLTGINRIMIGRIEREDYMPSISQLEELSRVLDFDILSLFVEKEKRNSFIALRSEDLSEIEQEGLDRLFEMMLSLRQQIFLRRKFENESFNRS